MAITMEINDHDGSSTLLIARDWISMTWKLRKYLTEREITYPLGEDNKSEMVTRRNKKRDT